MIENDFFTLLNDLNLGYTIAYPNMSFKPPAQGVWLEAKVLRNTGIDNGLNANSSRVEQGILQINVCDRPDKGIISLTDIANGIIGQIPKGTFIGDLQVVRTPYLMQPIYDDDRVILPITIQYSN